MSNVSDAVARIERLDKAFAAGVRALSVIDLGNYRKIKQRRDYELSILKKAGYK